MNDGLAAPQAVQYVGKSQRVGRDELCTGSVRGAQVELHGFVSGGQQLPNGQLPDAPTAPRYRDSHGR
jgi:hypothetical protein